MPHPSNWILAQIATDTEPYRAPAGREQRLRDNCCVSDLIAHTLQQAVQHLKPAAVIVPTRTGSMARNVTRFRLAQWITAFSARESTCQQLAFSYGVHPVKVDHEYQDWLPFARQWLNSNNLKAGMAVLSQGPSKEHPLASHRMEVLELST